MGMKIFWAASLFCLGVSSGAYADIRDVKEVVLSLGPSLYLNAEYGFLYSNTGILPAKLELLCADTDRPTHCGEINVHMQMKSYGVSAFWLNYTRKNPLLIHLHLDPKDAVLGDVLGLYIGGRAGGGLGLGARGMILVNADSGVLATTRQSLSPIGGKDRENSGFNVGVDLSVPQLEISYDGKEDLTRTLSSFAI